MAGGLLVAPRAVRAQQAGTGPVVGIVHDKPAGPSRAIRAVQEGLRRLGYVEGQTITFEVRFGGGKPETLSNLVRDLVQRKVAALGVIGPAALRAARAATGTAPIVALDLETAPAAAAAAPQRTRARAD